MQRDGRESRVAAEDSEGGGEGRCAPIRAVAVWRRLCVFYSIPFLVSLKTADTLSTRGVVNGTTLTHARLDDTIGYGSAHDLFDEQLDVRGFLRAQSLMQWLIVSTAAFMSMAFVSAFGIDERESSTVRALGAWDKELTVTHVDDIARVVAELVWEGGGDVWSGEGDGVSNGVVWVAGETVSYEALAECVEKVTGRKWNRELWTRGKLRQELKEDPEADLKKYRVIWTGLGIAWDKATSWDGRRGMEMSSLEDFAMEELRA